MCGIVGYIGNKDAVGIVMDGLRRLEYRGYDSAGVAVIRGGELTAEKREGKLDALARAVRHTSLNGSTLGIGHTRWATHGAPTTANAHPHFDESRRIAVCHNGIIENYASLRDQLVSEGQSFRSETDSETLPHLIRKYYAGELAAAVRRALQVVEGAYAIGVVCAEQPNVLIAARKGSPLVIGIGDGEAFLASDVPAIMRYTRRVMYLDDGHVATLTRTGVSVTTIAGDPIELPVHDVDWDDDAAEKGGYPHFMLKEIHEQPNVLRNTLRGRVVDGTVHLETMNISQDELRRCERIHIVACGTAWHAGLVGKYLIESLARVPVETDVASEYRYRDPIIPANTLAIAVSQSGETADTLEAVRIAKERGANVAAIVNAVGSSVAREAHGVVYQQAGPEIGVASTKAYTSQIMAFALFALWLAQARGEMTREDVARHVDMLSEIPDKVQWILDHQGSIQRCASEPRYLYAIGAFFMGRGYNFPTALEGALKLKEITYMHAEGYGAGEMKHGPIALVTDKLPVISLAMRSRTYDKMLSNIQEVRARKGIVLAIATDGDTEVMRHADDVIYVPDCYEPFSPILAVVPLQLLAYHIAANRGCDVDQPRNLAKSVTVE